jgi:hypothetical protein
MLACTTASLSRSAAILVEQQQLGRAHNGARNGDALLAAAELRAALAREGGKAVREARRSRARWRSAAAAAGRRRRWRAPRILWLHAVGSAQRVRRGAVGHVAGDAVGPQRRLLLHPAEAAPQRAARAHVRATNTHRARGRVVKAQQQLDDGALPPMARRWPRSNHRTLSERPRSGYRRAPVGEDAR